MALVRINHHPPAKQLWLFAALWCVFAGGWSIVLGLRNGWTTLPIALAVLSFAAPVLAIVSQEGARRLYVATCYAAFPIGWVVSHLLLAFVYYGVMTPIGLLMRVFGYDPLSRQIDRQAASYWVERDDPVDKNRYFRQF